MSGTGAGGRSWGQCQGSASPGAAVPALALPKEGQAGQGTHPVTPSEVQGREKPREELGAGISPF